MGRWKLTAVIPAQAGIQNAAASPSDLTASGNLDPRLRGDDSGNCLSRSDANELNQEDNA